MGEAVCSVGLGSSSVPEAPEVEEGPRHGVVGLPGHVPGKSLEADVDLLAVLLDLKPK